MDHFGPSPVMNGGAQSKKSSSPGLLAYVWPVCRTPKCPAWNIYITSEKCENRSKLSGKVLDGGPCTPFDPAPLGLALHEAQGEELVSTPVFITAGLNENNKN